MAEPTVNHLQPYLMPSHEVIARQNFYNQMAQQRPRSPSCAQVMGPFLGGQGPVVYEPLQTAPTPPYAQPTRGIGGPISLVAQSHCSLGLSRAAYARLYRAGMSENGYFVPLFVDSLFCIWIHLL